MEEDQRNVDIMLKLFDQVKDSYYKSDKEIQGLTQVIKDLFKKSSSPSHTDIVKMIENLHDEFKTHDNKILDPKGDVSAINNELKEIKNMLVIITKRLSTMITVVCVAVSLMTISYVFVNNSVSTMVNEQVNSTKQERVMDVENRTFDTKEIEEIKVLLKNMDDKIDDYVIKSNKGKKVTDG